MDAENSAAEVDPSPTSAGALKLSDPWRAWVEDNLRRNTSPFALVKTLRQQQLTHTQALSLVLQVMDEQAQGQRTQLARTQQLMQLRGQLRSEAIAAARFDPAGFYARHWETHTPLWAPGCVRDWADLSAWTPAALAQRFGQVPVYFQQAKGQSRQDQTPQAHRRSASLREFVALVHAATPGNELYMIAQDRNLQKGPLGQLLDELAVPEQVFDRARLRDGAALWLGPKGTVTSLHHDQSNILFCQMYGRKRITLASPDQSALLARAQGLYARVDPEQDSLPDLRFDRVELGPGDALFIPVGWWHHVRALETSVSLALNAFTRPNTFSDVVLGKGLT